jgi:hypothetical protein
VRLILTLLLQLVGLFVVVSSLLTLFQLEMGTSLAQNVFVIAVFLLIPAAGLGLVVLGARPRRQSSNEDTTRRE